MKFLQQCKSFKQSVLLLIAILTIMNVQAQALRAPANFVPDDEVIFVPLEYETHFLVRNIDLKDEKILQISNQINLWQNQQEFVSDWGIENTGLYTPPSQDEKINFIQRNFFRYVSNVTKEPLKQELNDWWNANDSEAEAKRAANVSNEIKVDQKNETKIEKNLIKSEKVELKFKPKPLKGYMAVTFRSSYFNADSILGINGKLDIHLYRDFKSIGLNTSAYYDVGEKRTITSISKSLTETISTAITSTFAPITPVKEDHRFSIRYSKSF